MARCLLTLDVRDDERNLLMHCCGMRRLGLLERWRPSSITCWDSQQQRPRIGVCIPSIFKLGRAKSTHHARVYSSAPHSRQQACGQHSFLVRANSETHRLSYDVALSRRVTMNDKTHDDQSEETTTVQRVSANDTNASDVTQRQMDRSMLKRQSLVKGRKWWLVLSQMS